MTWARGLLNIVRAWPYRSVHPAGLQRVQLRLSGQAYLTDFLPSQSGVLWRALFPRSVGIELVPPVRTILLSLSGAHPVETGTGARTRHFGVGLVMPRPRSEIPPRVRLNPSIPVASTERESRVVQVLVPLLRVFGVLRTF